MFYIPVLLTAFLFACGGDSVGNADNHNDDSESSSSEEIEYSSSADTEKISSSSSIKEQKRVSSSSSDKNKLVSSSSEDIEDPPDELSVVYVLVDGTVSGVVALDEVAKSAQVNVVQLDSADGYKDGEISYFGDVDKDGSYEIGKVNLSQPFVRLSVKGSIGNVVDGKTSLIELQSLSDATSGDVFNLNLLTTLVAERSFALLKNEENISFDEAKNTAGMDVWAAFRMKAEEFDATERIHVSDISESGAALLASTILLQAGADGDFEKFFKAVAADVAKDGLWDDEAARLAIADWALATDVKDGFASIRVALEKRLGKVADFEPYLKNFYLAELEFPKCDAETAGDVFFVKNESSSFYAADYADVSKSGERFVCNEEKGWTAIPDSLKDFMGETSPGKDGEVRRGVFSGEFFVYDGSSKSWRKATAVEKDHYFVLASKANEFVDIQDVYESIKDDERVIFLLRHAERTDDTSKGGKLTDNGKKQSEEVGARLTKFKDDFVLGASEFLRSHQTVESIANGRGQKSDVHDTLPQLNDDWYTKNSDAVEKAKGECGGGWEVTSKYAYTGAYSTGANAAYYNLAERSVELIEDVLVKKYDKEKFVLLSSHDKLMVPLVAYCSNLNIELKKYDGGKWINYLAGVAIIIDKSGDRRYVAVRGLKSGYAN